jgi:hypothetical protein
MTVRRSDLTVNNNQLQTLNHQPQRTDPLRTMMMTGIGVVGFIGANRACRPLGSRSFRRSNQRENLAVRFNAPREPLTSGPPGTGGCTARFLNSRPKWQGDLPAPVRPGALTRIYPRTRALGRFICGTSTTVLRFPDSQPTTLKLSRVG